MQVSLFRSAGLLPLLCLFLLLALAPQVAAGAGRLADTDLPGGDYRDFSLISPLPDFCEKVCAKDTRCKAWTFAWPGKRGKRAKCFLKESVPAPKKDTCCISGIKDGASSPQTATETAPSPQEGMAESGTEAKDEKAGGSDTSSERSEEETAAADTPAEEESTTGDAVAEGGPPPPGDDAPAGAGAGGDAAAAEASDQAALERAEKQRFCEAYAEAAMRANALNRQLGCGYTGGRWGASYRGYFNWCMRNDKERALANTRARERLIAQCRAAPPARVPPGEDAGAPADDDDPFGGPPVPAQEDLESCTLYSRISQTQAERARRLRCGFLGPEWKTSFGAHFAQCRRMTVEQRRRLIRARRAALKRCEGGLANPGELPARERGRVMRDAPFVYQWVQVRGPGRWRSGWRPSVSGKCPLVSACDCGPETCGVYPPGATALMWRRGCGAPPVVVQCRVRRNR
jgi:hypothetical protein